MSKVARPADKELVAASTSNMNSVRSAGSGGARSLETRMLGLALVIAIALSLLSPYFLTRNNLFNILDQSVVVGLVAIGMTFVILTAGIDLSVGSVVGLTGIILGLALKQYSIALAISMAVLAGA